MKKIICYIFHLSTFEELLSLADEYQDVPFFTRQIEMAKFYSNISDAWREMRKLRVRFFFWKSAKIRRTVFLFVNDRSQQKKKELRAIRVAARALELILVRRIPNAGQLSCLKVKWRTNKWLKTISRKTHTISRKLACDCHYLPIIAVCIAR